MSDSLSRVYSYINLFWSCMAHRRATINQGRDFYVMFINFMCCPHPAFSIENCEREGKVCDNERAILCGF